MIVDSDEKNLDENFTVYRALPKVGLESIGPFVFFDHIGPVVLHKEKEMKVRAHPHIGLSTLTYLLSGEILHRDSLMNEQLILPGEVNWMTAGEGIVHSERARSDNEPMLLEGVQVWVALPKEEESTAANFKHLTEKEIPTLHQKDLSLKLLAGTFEGLESPVAVHSDLFFLKGWAKSGVSYSSPLKSGVEASVYVLGGVLEVEGQSCHKNQMAVFKNKSEIEFLVKEEAEFIVFGGVPFKEIRHIWWNFVSSDLNKIDLAKKRWKNDEFLPVINECEFIPLPKD